jgi:DnaJ-class molecular chaperone
VNGLISKMKKFVKEMLSTDLPEFDPKIHKICEGCNGSGLDPLGSCLDCDGNGFVEKN